MLLLCLYSDRRRAGRIGCHLLFCWLDSLSTHNAARNHLAFSKKPGGSVEHVLAVVTRRLTGQHI